MLTNNYNPLNYHSDTHSYLILAPFGLTEKYLSQQDVSSSPAG